MEDQREKMKRRQNKLRDMILKEAQDNRAKKALQNKDSEAQKLIEAQE